MYSTPGFLFKNCKVGSKILISVDMIVDCEIDIITFVFRQKLVIYDIALDKRGYQEISFLFLNENVCCVYSLEAPRGPRRF